MQATQSSWEASDWLALTSIVALAVLVRAVFFSGFFGSDEVTYTLAGVEIANGIWRLSDYVGSLRYGVNIPVGVFIKLFGPGEIPAAAWSFLCSVGEVVLVFIVAHSLWGRKAAVLSALVIATLPLHVHLAGRLMADSPLAFFITLSFVLFLFAERRQSTGLYLASGLAAGAVFWVKEVVILYLVVFGLYALIYRGWKMQWLWAVLGGSLLIILNSLLSWVIFGDPGHIATVGFGPLSEDYALVKTSAWYYIRYLFFDLRHTWIVGYLALGGVVLWVSRGLSNGSFDKDTGYVVLWGLGLLAVFSFFVMSVDPALLIAKQTNYMLIFLAPLALLAGYFLAKLKRAGLLVTGFVLAAGSLTLSALEQQAVRVFTANSKAALAFALRQPDASVYGLTNAYRAGVYYDLMQGRTGSAVKSLSELKADGGVAKNYVVVDLETIAWGKNSLRKLEDVPACWRKIHTLTPAGFGNGEKVAASLQAATSWLPKRIGSVAEKRLNELRTPEPAFVYEVSAACALSSR